MCPLIQFQFFAQHPSDRLCIGQNMQPVLCELIGPSSAPFLTLFEVTVFNYKNFRNGMPFYYRQKWLNVQWKCLHAFQLRYLCYNACKDAWFGNLIPTLLIMLHCGVCVWPLRAATIIYQLFRGVRPFSARRTLLCLLIQMETLSEKMEWHSMQSDKIDCHYLIVAFFYSTSYYISACFCCVHNALKKLRGANLTQQLDRIN